MRKRGRNKNVSSPGQGRFPKGKQGKRPIFCKNYFFTARITWEALTAALTLEPLARFMRSALTTVMVEVRASQEAVSMSTSVATLPLRTSVTVPVKMLRVEKM